MRKCQSLAAAVVVATMLIGLSPSFSAPVARAEQDRDGLGACAPGVQLLGFSEALNKTTFGGFDLAELSALAYDPWNNVYYAVADRAGSIQSHFFTLDLPITGGGMGAPTVRAVTPLSDAEGAAFTGANFDGEGAVLTSQGTLYISSEGGSTAGEQPEIHQFSVSGEYLGQLAVPPRFLVGVNNQSLEGLALSPEGRSLFTANEGPLPSVESAPEDGLTDDLRNRVRILRYEDRELAGFVPADQFYYATEPNRAPGDVGVVELIALSETTLLVLERGFVPGEGNTVRLFRTSIEGARDVSAEPTLAAPELEPLAKTLVFDLADCPGDGATLPAGATQPNPLLDNFEGISLGPRLPDGRRVLLLVSDDNFGANQTTRLVAVAMTEEVLAGNSGMN